jgi:hypothetical protein
VVITRFSRTGAERSDRITRRDDDDRWRPDSAIAATIYRNGGVENMTKYALAIAAVGIATVAIAARAQQFPMIDMAANRLIQKYQGSSCEQLWQERSQKQNQPKTPEEQHAITMLQRNPQMRAAFIDKVAAPIANKMFDCGMIP